MAGPGLSAPCLGDARDDEADSAFGDQNSELTSPSPSCNKFVRKHGRLYHPGGSYLLPNDDEELERLEMLHHAYHLALNGRLFLAPIGRNPRRVLDVGTGTGIWPIQFAEKHPGTEVRGYDLALCQPSALPPNVEFIVDDVEKDWLDTNQYDYIHLRSLTGIRDWPRLLRQIYDNLHPGGWVELQGLLNQLWSEDGTPLPENPLAQLMDGLKQAGDKCGRTMDPAASFRQLAESAGFESVEEQRFPLPVGSWADDPTLKKIGEYIALSFSSGVEGMTVVPLMDILQWPEEEVDELNARVREATNRQDIHAVVTFVVVTGMKPEV